METIGQNIKRLRKERNLTQKDLAALLGISAQSVGQWERDESNPKTGSLVRLATAMNVDVSEITGVKTFKSPNDFKEEWNRLIASDDSAGEVRIVHGVVPLTSDQMQRITAAANHLTKEGIAEAVDRFCEVSEIPKYKK